MKKENAAVGVGVGGGGGVRVTRARARALEGVSASSRRCFKKEHKNGVDFGLSSNTASLAVDPVKKSTAVLTDVTNLCGKTHHKRTKTSNFQVSSCPFFSSFWL